jgi:hypothetical protein
MSLKLALVNAANIAQGIEITEEEMNNLAGSALIFMCFKDTNRLSDAGPGGVLAFHPTMDDPSAYEVLVKAIKKARNILSELPEMAMMLDDGRFLRIPKPPNQTGAN